MALKYIIFNDTPHAKQNESISDTEKYFNNLVFRLEVRTIFLCLTGSQLSDSLCYVSGLDALHSNVKRL